MVDLYQDFCFAALSTGVDDSQTNWAVDDVTGFPNNALLAKSDFWLVAEVPLTHPAAFEIVKLTGVDISSSTLTVIRAQQGTAGVSHDPGVLVKGALTVAMLHQVRGAMCGPTVPALDSDLYQIGDRFYTTAEGVFYRHTGRAPFISQTNFTTITGSQTLPDPYVASTSWRTSGKLHWVNIEGAIGNALDTDDRYGCAVPLEPSGAHRAIALLNVGAADYSLAVTMNTPVSSTADAGILLCASPDGQSGLYLSTAPGSPPRVLPLVDGVLGAGLGDIGTAAVPDSSYIQFSIEMDGADVTIWYQSSIDLATTNFSARATFAAPATTGAFGLMANSADAFTDALLTWNQVIVQPSVIGRNDALTNVTDSFSRFDAAGTPVDEPTSVPRFGPFTRDWDNTIGVWGITDPDGHGQSARYQSGAVNDMALLSQDIRSRVSDMAFALNTPTDISALDFGVLVFATNDGQNGLYVRLVGGHSAICAVVDGEVQATELVSGDSPVNGGLIVLRIVTSDSDITVIDLRASTLDSVLLRMPLDPADGNGAGNLLEFGGTRSGLLLADAATLTAGISFNQVAYYETNLPAGWQPEPSFSHGAGRPHSSRPPGSLYVDIDDDAVYYATGSGEWLPFSINTVGDITAQNNWAAAIGALFMNTSDSGLFMMTANGMTRAGWTFGVGSPVDNAVSSTNAASIYIDIDSPPAIWIGDQSNNWVSLLATPDWQPVTLPAGWTANDPVEYYLDRDRTYLRGSAIFTGTDSAATHPIFDNAVMIPLRLGGGHTVALPTHDTSTDAWGIAYVVFGYESYVVSGYTDGAILYLDGVSWRHT